MTGLGVFLQKKEVMSDIQVFKYILELDAFICTPEYLEVASKLGLCEWNPVVWIGRLLCMDNDYGEHWFDNWDEREQVEEKAKEIGFTEERLQELLGYGKNGSFEDLFIVSPDRFKDGCDGPCNSSEVRKMFWTDVLKSLKINLETMFEEARYLHEKYCNRYDEDDKITDLETRIKKINNTIETHQNLKENK